MPADYSRIHRMLKILMLIQGSPGWTAKQLATECKTTDRSIYRDLRIMTDSGVPCTFNRKTGGYILRQDFFMPAVSLTLDESLSLVALAEQIGGQQQVPFTKSAAKAIAKVRCNLPPVVQQELKKMDDRVTIRLSAASEPDESSDVYDVVRAALSGLTSLECEYDSVSASKSSKVGKVGKRFSFSPYSLFFNQRAWYTVGHHGGAGEIRCLKLNRFTSCKPTKQAYKIPVSFSVAKHLGNAWRMIRGDKTYNVELHFDAEFAETIADTHWHATQELVWQADKSLIFQCTVDGLDEIVWWVLSMGPHCTVHKPVELRERVADLARRTANLYAGQKPKARPKMKKAGSSSKIALDSPDCLACRSR